MNSTANAFGQGAGNEGFDARRRRGDGIVPEQVGERTVSMPPLGEHTAQGVAGLSSLAWADMGEAEAFPEHAVVSHQTRRGHKTLWIVLLSILAALIVLMVGSFFAARAYFQDRVAPGVSFGNVSVVGKDARQINAMVNGMVQRSTITVSDGQGKTVKASLRDLGVNVDTHATVRALIGAKGTNPFNRLNPFNHATVPLSATANKLTAGEFVTTAFVTPGDRAVPSSIAFNNDTHTFTATEGKGGSIPESEPVNAAVDRMIAQPGTPATVKVGYRSVDMPISMQSATDAANQANARLSAPITLTAGDHQSFTVPAQTLASWITPAGDPAKGQISLQYDRQAIADYVANDLPNELNRKMVSQQDIVDSHGKLLMTKVPGVDGVTVKNLSAVSGPIYQALAGGQGGALKVDADVQAHDVKQTVSKYHIVVDKTKQVASVYDGDDLVKIFLVCTGRSGGDESDSGTFTIYLRYRTQDMRGLNNDGTPYLSKDVHWVSYYNGGEGFHTANWNHPGIAKGDPSDNGSHGCINMYEQDAQWIYDNCPEGTLVNVVGNQPSGPVRG
ncbi:L,D-transpeptidase [Bifidobacterium mongoliense]|uniref:L,D-transpeptidase n=1 Tax=Bifidobacterium mongoliense TaxID=518643 RepID=UPI00264A4CA4|nr:L,D-transpeptidase [Bifidobacterium mongoliense]MDN6025973.1 L,D-transpeptidase [Bifidobacterium mongoliense]MDN6050560.1 L,D-transpeptidase [Bifidobacterium mongoliense]